MLKKEKRPKCPRCNTSDPISHGSLWWCKSCGRQWIKNPSKRLKLVNPVCQYCGGSTVRNGLSYRCKACGKSVVKVRARKEVPTINDLCRAPIIDA